MNFTFQVTGSLFTKRGHRQVMREVLRDAMEFIRDVYWPIHFTPAAFNRYPDVYEKRSKGWQIRKARKHGHQNPNVWSGRLRENVLKNSVIRGTADRASLTARSYFPLPTQRRRELEVVNRQEQQQVQAMIQRLYVQKSRDPRYADRVRQRVR